MFISLVQILTLLFHLLCHGLLLDFIMFSTISLYPLQFSCFTKSYHIFAFHSVPIALLQSQPKCSNSLPPHASPSATVPTFADAAVIRIKYDNLWESVLLL